MTSVIQVLLLDHPRKRIRDTAKYKPFQEKVKVIGTLVKYVRLLFEVNMKIFQRFDVEV